MSKHRSKRSIILANIRNLHERLVDNLAWTEVSSEEAHAIKLISQAEALLHRAWPKEAKEDI